jgi:hypothetical protein
MTTTTYFVETIELDPELRQRLVSVPSDFEPINGPRPDLEGIDAKTLASLALFDFMAHSEDEKISRDEFYRARRAAGLILQKHYADVQALFGSNITAKDLELI